MKLKQLSVAVLFSVLVMNASLLPAKQKKIPEFPYEKRPLAAVMPMNYTATSHPEFAKTVGGVADSLAAALVQTGRLRLVERTRVEDLLTEQKLAQTGMIDTRTASSVGKQLGAKLVVLGSVTGVSVRDEGRSVKFAEKTTRTVDVEAEARLVDVETGELVSSGKAMGKAVSAEKHAFGGKVGSLASEEDLVVKAIQGLGEKLAHDLAGNIQPLK